MKLQTAIFLPVLFALCSLPAAAQSKPDSTPTIVVPQGPASSTGVLITPAMKTDDLLRIRNLQYEQDKSLLEMQRIEARYKELQQSIRALSQQLDQAVLAGANASGVDLSKFVFDLDTLRFVPRPQPKQLEAKPK